MRYVLSACGRSKGADTRKLNYMLCFALLGFALLGCHRFIEYASAMQRIEEAGVKSKSAADKLLAEVEPVSRNEALQT